MEIKENLPKELSHVHSTSSAATPKKSPLVSPNVNDQHHQKIQSPIPEITILPVPEVTTTTTTTALPCHKEMKKARLSPKDELLNGDSLDAVREKSDEMEESFGYPDMSSPYQSAVYSQQSPMSLVNGNINPALLHQDDISKIMTQVRR